MSTLVALGIAILERVLGVVERRVNKPAKPAAPKHSGVSDAELDRLLKQATKGLN